MLHQKYLTTFTQECKNFKKLSLLNNVEYAALLYKVMHNGESVPFPNLNNLSNNTNWQDNLFGDAMITNHNISLSVELIQ